MPNFTTEEKKVLAPFFSNLDRDVFVLFNLPEVVKGALFSRYSRSTKDLRRMLLDEFLKQEETGLRVGKSTNFRSALEVVDKERAESFYDRVLVGYGDDSVAELAGVHVACENVSQLIAAKALEDNRIGISPLEKSTRYVRFDDRDEKGNWKYYRDPDIAKSHANAIYLQACDHLFATYTALIEPLSKYLTDKFPKESEMTERAYASTMRAKACDVLRQLLPCATLTNVGIFGNGRALEYTIIKMLASPFAEVRALASDLKTELDKVIPSFVKRSTNERGMESQKYLTETRTIIDSWARRLKNAHANGVSKPQVKLVDFAAEAEERLLVGFFYDRLNLPYRNVLAAVRRMRKKDRKEFFSKYFALRQHRTHKPGRALEMTSYTFDIVSTIACYKDIQRHRMLSLYKPIFTCELGYELPKEITEAKLQKPYKQAMDLAARGWQKLTKRFPHQAQYLIPIGFYCRWLMNMTLREVNHLTELRSTRQGHPSYRFVAQEVAKRVREAHPLLGTLATNFVDFNAYELERAESEKRIDRKLAQLGKRVKDF